MIQQQALSDAYFENDLIGVRYNSLDAPPRLCVVIADGAVQPLCIHADDAETDLFVDPREFGSARSTAIWSNLTDDMVTGSFGEGFYGQRPVPSLGGGPGYGALADEIWTISVETLDKIRASGVEIPVIDVGIAHGEKARAGAF